MVQVTINIVLWYYHGLISKLFCDSLVVITIVRCFCSHWFICFDYVRVSSVQFFSFYWLNACLLARSSIKYLITCKLFGIRLVIDSGWQKSCYTEVIVAKYVGTKVCARMINVLFYCVNSRYVLLCTFTWDCVQWESFRIYEYAKS